MTKTTLKPYYKYEKGAYNSIRGLVLTEGEIKWKT